LYQAFYKLRENPFRLNPDPAFMCMTEQHREALSALVYSATTRPGLTVLLGEAGTGKTTLLFALMQMLQKRRVVMAMCNNPTLSRAEFYDLLVVKFEVECASTLKSRQLAGLQDALQRHRADGRAAMLIIDEAQRLPVELLEEIRLLLNMETPREKLLDIIMAGQPELGDILHRPDLRQLKQRVSCLCRLEPLSAAQVSEYVHHRLTHAGLVHQTLFSPETIRLIHEYTQGIPRLVNSLCDTALRTGFALQSPVITAAVVEEAARELELIPQAPKPAAAEPRPVVVNGAPRAPVAAAAAASAGQHANGNGTGGAIPLEAYNNRQKSLGFIASVLNRWR
jgi:type II secretory pathway predicted ATPase ExeA